jgi:hypothetical protein
MVLNLKVLKRVNKLRGNWLWNVGSESSMNSITRKQLSGPVLSTTPRQIGIIQVGREP